MRIGVMVGPERGRYATKVDRLRADARWAEEAGLASVWVPQIPDEFDALTAAALIGAETSGSRSAPPSSPSSPATRSRSPSRRCRCRPCARAASRSASACRTTGSSTRCSACPTSGRSPTMRAHLDVLDQALRRARARSTSRTSCSGCTTRSTSPTSRPTPVLLAALGPVMLRLAGERTDGTILWMADERAIGSHVVPHLTAAAEARRPAGAPHRRRHPGVPVRRRRGRRGRGPDQPHPVRGRGVAELPAAARPRRRPRRRRPPRRRQRGQRREAPALLRRRRRHRPVGPGRADRRGPRRAARLVDAPAATSRR